MHDDLHPYYEVVPEPMASAYMGLLVDAFVAEGLSWVPDAPRPEDLVRLDRMLDPYQPGAVAHSSWVPSYIVASARQFNRHSTTAAWPQ